MADEDDRAEQRANEIVWVLNGITSDLLAEIRVAGHEELADELEAKLPKICRRWIETVPGASDDAG